MSSVKPWRSDMIREDLEHNFRSSEEVVQVAD